MTLYQRLHAYLTDPAHLSHVGFELDELAFIFAGDDRHDIERALRQLQRDGLAREQGAEWFGLEKEEVREKQKALFG